MTVWVLRAIAHVHMQFQNPIIMRELAVGVHILSSPRPVGQDWTLLPEGAQPPYDDHNSLQDVKVSFHTALNTKLSQPSQGLKIVCFIRTADPESDIILSYKCQLQNVMAQFCNMQD